MKFKTGICNELKIEYISTLSEQYMFEMANIPKKYTGLPYDIWIDSMGSDRANKHSVPRIKLKVDNTLIPVTISDKPEVPSSVLKNGNVKIKEFSKIRDFIVRYKVVLLMHFYRELDDVQTITLLHRIKDTTKLNQLSPEEVVDLADSLLD